MPYTFTPHTFIGFSLIVKISPIAMFLVTLPLTCILITVGIITNSSSMSLTMVNFPFVFCTWNILINSIFASHLTFFKHSYVFCSTWMNLNTIAMFMSIKKFTFIFASIEIVYEFSLSIGQSIFPFSIINAWAATHWISLFLVRISIKHTDYRLWTRL